MLEERDLKGGFLSGLVVRILGFLCCGPGSIPAREAEILQAMRHGQKKNLKKKKKFFSHGNLTATGKGSIPTPLSDLGGCLPSPGLLLLMRGLWVAPAGQLAPQAHPSLWASRPLFSSNAKQQDQVSAMPRVLGKGTVGARR